MWTRSESSPLGLGPGDVLGPYKIDEFIGEGGTSVAFRAVREDGTTVALKILKRHIAGDDVAIRRFMHEARAAQEVRHPHLVPIVEAGESGEMHFIATAYVAGPTLHQLIKRDGPLPLPDLVRLIAQVASALDRLHKQGFVHRDVKSSNILLDERGDAYLTDLGLAKGPEYTTLTLAGRVMGTIDYLAPELIRGQPAGPGSDIYGLGCVVYEALAGHCPFSHRGHLQIGVAHLEEEPPDHAAGRRDVPESFTRVALLALAKDPSQRPPTAVAYARLLQTAARGT